MGRWQKVLVSVIGLLALFIGGLWLGRSAIATYVARAELEARGLRCDERFALEVDGGFGGATLAPTRCELVADGIIESFELVEPSRVELSGFAASSIDVPSFRLSLAEREVHGGSQWGSSELRRLGLEQAMAGLVKGLEELSRLPVPPTRVNRFEVQRGGAALTTLNGLEAAGTGEVLTLTFVTAAFSAGPGGVGRLTLEAVEGRAVPGEVRLSGRALGRAGIGPLSVSTRGGFSLTATELDTANPRFSVNLGR